MQFDRYQHSGNTGRAWLLVPLVGLPVLALLSLAYSYIAVYNPLAGIVTFLVLGGYVFATGFTIGYLGKWAKCRSATTLRLLGLIGGGVCLYLAWAVFLYALMNRYGKGVHLGLADLVFHPDRMWSLIGAVNETGWYTIKKMTPSGIVLWAFWTIEAAVIVGGTMWLAPIAIDQEMFCERCDGWCPVKETKYLAIDAPLVAAPLASLELLPLLARPSTDAKVLPSVRMELLECPKCTTFKGLRFVRLTETVDNEGKKSETSENLPGIHHPPGVTQG